MHPSEILWHTVTHIERIPDTVYHFSAKQGKREELQTNTINGQNEAHEDPPIMITNHPLHTHTHTHVARKRRTSKVQLCRHSVELEEESRREKLLKLEMPLRVESLQAITGEPVQA